MDSRFSCVTPGMEKFSLDLPWAVENRECALEVGCGGVFRSWVRGICNYNMIQGENLWLYKLQLEQAMRNLACGDQLILLMVIWLVLTRVRTVEISYYWMGSCVYWACFGSGVWGRVGGLWNWIYLFWGDSCSNDEKMGWPSKVEILHKQFSWKPNSV